MFQHSAQILDVVRASFHRRRILVVGDLMLDKYLWGNVDRISPAKFLMYPAQATRS